MPTNATTTASRAAATRLAKFTNLAGNVAVAQQIADDAASTTALRALVAGSASPPAGMVAGLDGATLHQQNVIAQMGVVAWFPVLEADGASLDTACAYVEGLP